MRTVWARAFVALLVAVAVVVVWIWGFDYFGEELDLEFVAWPVGIGAALAGYLLVGLVFRRFGPKAAPMHLTVGALRRQVDRKLATLPEVSHTIHDLGDPWPKAVIGPTGVYLVEPRAVREHIGYVEGQINLDGRPAGNELFGEVRRLLPMVEELLHERHGIVIPVQGVIAVDDATIVPPPLQAGDAPVRVVPVNHFPDAVDFGEPTTHEVVREAADAIRRWRPATR